MKKFFLCAFLALNMDKALSQPTTAAAPPVANAGTVLSLFGSHYTAVSQAAGVNTPGVKNGVWYPDWGQPTNINYANVGSDTTIEYSNLSYEGVAFNGSVDASAYDSVHFSIYSTNVTSLQIYLISLSPTSQHGPTFALTTGVWNNIVLPLSDFNGVVLSNIGQMSFTAESPTTGGIIYLENIYFNQSVGKPTISPLVIPTQTVGATYTITDPTSTSSGAFTYTSSNTAVATVSGNIITCLAGGTTTITAIEDADPNNGWLASSVSTTLIVAFATPSNAATAPTADPANVISVFGSHYTPIAAAAGTGLWHQGWGDHTTVNYENIGSDTTMVSTNFNYQGVQFTSTINVSAMDSLHLDIWSPNVTKIYIDLIGGGETDYGYSLPLALASGWNSLNIPLSNYPAVNLAALLQFKFDITPNNAATNINNDGVVYYENIYFFRAAGKPAITGFSIPTQTYSGNTFTYTITNPTSPSNGAFSYASSNTAVATISGNTVTILSGGTASITVTQAADPTNGYLAGTATTTLTVVFADPTTSAPTPTDDPANVVSLFGDHYTNVSAAAGKGVWGQTWGGPYIIPTYERIAGDTTMIDNNLGYQGVQLSSSIDISGYDTLHVDVWTPNLTSIYIDLIGTSETDKQYALTTYGWNHLAIPLSNYSNIGLTKLLQFKFDRTTLTPSTGGTLYMQNIYFSRPAGKPTITGFTVPSGKITTSAPFTITDPTSNSSGAFSYTSSNTAVATISGNTVTITGAGITTITATQAADPTNGYIAGTATTVLTVGYPAPITAAALPTAVPADVISLWGDKYTNVTGTTWDPYWGQPVSVITSYPKIGGKSTVEYSSLSYEGIQFASSIDASLMDSLHFDVWTPNCTNFDLYLINTGTGQNELVNVTPTTNGWNSINLPMSSYSLEASSVGQFKIVANTPIAGAVLYFQNIYFFKTPGKPTIGSLTLPSGKTSSSAPFTITAPTSNSSGTFTYTSATASVATISGNLITIHGAGTTVITATQAADLTDGYVSGSVSAVLTVAYPGPTTAASVPTASAGNVISLWGNTYTNVAGTTWNPNWGQPSNEVVTTSTITVGGKTTLEYSNLAYEGVQFASNINASAMNLLHFDVWTPNCTNFDLYLINTGNGQNQFVTISPTTSGWNSINIPMSNYSLESNAIGQFKIVSNAPTSGAVLYFQNIYFVNATPTWTGATSSDFSLATNWQYSLMPNSTNNISIPAALTHEPVLNANTTFAGIALNGSLDINGTTLTLTGAVSGTGNLLGSPTSSIVIAGTVGTLNFNTSANSLKNLTVTSGSATLGNALNIYGTFTPTAGTFNTGGFLTLKSTSITNSAVVGVVGGTVIGTVTVERFLPQGFRVYRDLATGVANAGNVYKNWQESGNNSNGYGIKITGVLGSSNATDPGTGLDFTPLGNHSMFTYKDNVWDSVYNTLNTQLDPYQGYRTLVRGNRSINLFQAPQPTYMLSSATLRSTGNLVTGQVTFTTSGTTGSYNSSYHLTSGDSNFTFVANPYVCPIDWNSVLSHSTGITASYTYADPTFTANDGLLTYVSFNSLVGKSNNPTGSNLNQYIQPGQAFFIQNGTGTTPQLVIKESDKAASSTKTSIFSSPTKVNNISISLNNAKGNVDGALLAFASTFKQSIGEEDTYKFNNGAENVSLVNSGHDLSIEGLPMPTAQDVIPVHLFGLKANTNYTIGFDASEFTGNGVAAYVKDNGKISILSGNNTISFTTTGTTPAALANRFSIVFAPVALPISSIALSATATDSHIALSWKTVGSDAASYTIERNTGNGFVVMATVGASTFSFVDAIPSQGLNSYRIIAVAQDGSTLYSPVASANIDISAALKLTVTPNPVVGSTIRLKMVGAQAGSYTIRIMDAEGKLVYTTRLEHGLSNAESLNMHNKLAVGTYTLQAIGANNKLQTQLEVQ